jgi:hypothetical protein
VFTFGGGVRLGRRRYEAMSEMRVGVADKAWVGRDGLHSAGMGLTNPDIDDYLYCLNPYLF